MTDIWNATQYLQFADARTRPAMDLITQVNYSGPHTIYDLGCGPGNSTELLYQRWPQAQIIGVDSSEDMLVKARALLPALTWIQADVATWQADKPADIIFSNATLQWLENHEILFPRLLKSLAPNGVLAVQMPRNYQSPSHLTVLETVEAGPWRERLLPLLRYGKNKSGPVANPAFYYQLLAPYTKNINIWETEYLQILEGENPVVEWIKGTGLRPILAALDASEQAAFLADYSARLKEKYPQNPDGKTLFPFKRLFIVAQV